MNPNLDKTELKSIAAQLYRFMIMEHAGKAELGSSVDVNPASWGLEINDWDWCPGVGVNAISDYFSACQQAEVLAYLVEWVERNQHKARKFQHVNVMTPFGIFPDMYRRTGNPYFMETALDYGHWIVQNSVRTLTGALQHGGGLTEEIWADTIFMVVLFLARLGRLSGDAMFSREAVNQLLLHLQYLQDPQTGVLFHGYDCAAKNHKSGARWTRGNAWITLATPLILAETQDMVDVPVEITQRYRRLVDGLLTYQAANGRWHTVMDRPTFYQESSGTAGIACGILKSIHQGLLPPTYLPPVEKAVSGMLEVITPQGEVTSVSGGTPIMATIEEYNQLSRYPTLYGQGLTLMLLAEYSYK